MQHVKGRFYPVKVTSFHIINGALLILNLPPLEVGVHCVRGTQFGQIVSLMLLENCGNTLV